MFEAQLLPAEDSSEWLSARITPIVKKNKAESAIVMLRNTTQRKSAEQELRKSKERYALASKGANDGLWD